MGTCVRRSILNAVVRRDAPHLVVFSSSVLEEVAAAVVAQPDPAAFEVYANCGSFSRDPDAHERERLAALTR